MCKEVSFIKSSEFRRRAFVSKQSNMKDVQKQINARSNSITTSFIIWLTWVGKKQTFKVMHSQKEIQRKASSGNK